MFLLAASSVSDLVVAVQSLPWAMHALVGTGMLAGLTLWVLGRRMIRLVTVLVGMALGGAIGFVMLPVLVPAAGLSPYVGMVGGMVSGLLTALMLYQIASAVTFGGVLAGACAVVAAGIVSAPNVLPSASAIESVELAALGEDGPSRLGGEEEPDAIVAPPVRETDPQPAARPAPRPATKPTPTRAPEARPHKPAQARVPQGEPQDETPDVEPPLTPVRPAPRSRAPEPSRASPPVIVDPTAGDPNLHRPTRTARPPTTLTRDEDLPLSESREGTLSSSNRLRTFWSAARNEWARAWGDLPARARWWISGSALFGLVAGTIAGVFMPQWAAGALTALVGAAIWLPCGLWLTHAWNVAGMNGLNLSPMAWTIVWVVLAMVGMAIQWMGLFGSPEPVKAGKKRKKKPAAEEE